MVGSTCGAAGSEMSSVFATNVSRAELDLLGRVAKVFSSRTD